MKSCKIATKAVPALSVYACMYNYLILLCFLPNETKEPCMRIHAETAMESFKAAIWAL